MDAPADSHVATSVRDAPADSHVAGYFCRDAPADSHVAGCFCRDAPADSHVATSVGMRLQIAMWLLLYGCTCR